MSDMDNRLLQEIDRIVWSDEPETGKILAIQNLMYQWGQNMDAKTEDLWQWDDPPTPEEAGLPDGLRRG